MNNLGDTVHRTIRKRRSAVAFDGVSRMPLEHLNSILATATRDFSADFRPHFLIEIYLYIHRVDGIGPGLYVWERALQKLTCLKEEDQRWIARGASCFQDIGTDSYLTLSMIADLKTAFTLFGERGYRYVHYEAGFIGQYLYLGATTLGHDATGIGCFQDDEINEHLALPEGREVVYNFCIGKGRVDPRLTTLPSYDFVDPTLEEDRMPGTCTQEGTQRYAKRWIDKGLQETTFRPLGKTKWLTSSLGFGCYRIDDRNPDHKSSLTKALSEGCNLIDTSTNYTDGESETCVGKVISSLSREKIIQREEVIIVSKVGYIQGENLELAREAETKGEPFSEVVKYMDECWHCIHPRFIADQLSRSIERTKLQQIDVYLLHNPEYFLSDAKKREGKTPLTERRTTFYDRIKKAFHQLEQEVSDDRIGWYGVSSNTFTSPADDPEATSLTKMWVIAREVARERTGDPNAHHFAVVQLPANLFEGGSVLNKNNGEGNNLTVLQFAEEKDLAVLINRPLNAVVGNQMVRLADFPTREIAETFEMQTKKVMELEEGFAKEIAPNIETEKASVSATKFFCWADELSKSQLGVIGLEHWRQIESQMVQPQVRYLISEMDRQLTGPLLQKWEKWRNAYIAELEQLLEIVRNNCAGRSQKISHSVSQLIEPFLPQPMKAETLSRKALAVLVNTPGVTCVLNGMREPRYVDDALGVLQLPSFKVETKLYEAFRK